MSVFSCSWLVGLVDKNSPIFGSHSFRPRRLKCGMEVRCGEDTASVDGAPALPTEPLGAPVVSACLLTVKHGKSWYLRLTIGRHVRGLAENSDKPVLWPLAFLCQNSTMREQEQSIVGHGNVYLPCSHPDQQLCSSGPEKHWLCKLSLPHTLPD